MLLFEEAHAIVSPTIDKLINFVIYLAALVFLLRKPMANLFARRSAEIEEQLKRSEREKQEALAQLKAVEERLNKLDAEIAEIKARAAQEAEAERARILASAQEDAAKLRETAEREIQGLVKAARLELKSYTAEQSVALAEGIIRREMRPEDAHRIITTYVDELEGARQ